MLEHVNCSTPDLAEETARKLAALLPECAGENGEIDLDKLRQCLSSKAVEGNVERYRFEWPGKRAAMAAASAATTKTLRPCREESVDYDTTGNLYIEGDNLEVLKLLQTGYAGRIKMIYIDPPYNTGHDFVYRDRFSLTQKELDSQAGAFDEDGNRFEVNDSAEARYHSNWCSMMWPRLKLARNLLRDDGVIFISIDDNEVANLRKLCDEIFGESNFVGQWNWYKSATPPNLSRKIKKNIEYILCYERDKTSVKYAGIMKTSKSSNGLMNQTNSFHDLVFPANSVVTGLPNGIYHAGKYGTESYDIRLIKDAIVANGKFASEVHLSGKFKWSQNNLDREIANGTIISIRTTTFSPSYDKQEYDPEVPPNFIDKSVKVETTEQAGDALNALFEEKKVFEYPKPVSLLAYLLSFIRDPDSLVLDFFSGSATTAHAVMQLNAEDGGNRKFIMVQLPEVCDPDSEAAKAGYKNICEIGKERIRRAGKKIEEEVAAKNSGDRRKDPTQEELFSSDSPALCGSKRQPDTGFRVLKLASSSLIDAGRTVGETEQGELALSRIRDDRSPEDLLFQVLLETRIPLSDAITTDKVGGNEVFFVGGAGEGTPLVACLDPKARMDSQFFLDIAKLRPGLAFFRDDAFADDSARTNLQQVFNQFSPNTSVKVI